MPKTVLPAHQARSRKSLERLLEAARQILEEDGLERATIPRIAARAGLSPGAVYRRFPDKDALLREVCIRLFESNYERTKEKLSPEHWEGVSLADMARRVIATTIHGQRKHRGLLRAMFLFILQHPNAAFVRQGREFQGRVLREVGDLLLTRRDEIRHPEPEAAVKFGMLMVGLLVQGVIVSASGDPKRVTQILGGGEEVLERELPRMLLRYLGVENSESSTADKVSLHLGKRSG